MNQVEHGKPYHVEYRNSKGETKHIGVVTANKPGEDGFEYDFQLRLPPRERMVSRIHNTTLLEVS